MSLLKKSPVSIPSYFLCNKKQLENQKKLTYQNMWDIRRGDHIAIKLTIQVLLYRWRVLLFPLWEQRVSPSSLHLWVIRFPSGMSWHLRTSLRIHLHWICILKPLCYLWQFTRDLHAHRDISSMIQIVISLSLIGKSIEQKLLRLAARIFLKHWEASPQFCALSLELILWLLRVIRYILQN